MQASVLKWWPVIRDVAVVVILGLVIMKVIEYRHAIQDAQVKSAQLQKDEAILQARIDARAIDNEKVLGDLKYKNAEIDKLQGSLATANALAAALRSGKAGEGIKVAPVVTPAGSDAEPPNTPILPDDPGTVKLSKETAQEIIKRINSCNATDILEANCEASTKDLQGKLVDMTADRDQWKSAATGGTKWQRLVKKLEVIGCAGAGAGIGAPVAGTKGAVIGAVTLASVCAILSHH